MTIIIEMPWLRKDINLLGFKCKSNNMTIFTWKFYSKHCRLFETQINFGPAASTIWRSLQWGLGAESTECMIIHNPPTLRFTVLKEPLSCTKNPSLAPKIWKFSCKKNSRIIQAFELGENLPKIPLKMILIEPSFRKDGLRVVWSRKAFMELFRWDRIQKLLNGNGTDHEAWQKPLEISTWSSWVCCDSCFYNVRDANTNASSCSTEYGCISASQVPTWPPIV